MTYLLISSYARYNISSYQNHQFEHLIHSIFLVIHNQMYDQINIFRIGDIQIYSYDVDLFCNFIPFIYEFVNS